MKEREKKMPYTPPKAIRLSSLEEGEGACNTGSGDVGKCLNNGIGAADKCNNTGSSAGTCTKGNAATT